MSMTLEAAPDITPIEHDKGNDHSAPATAPSDAEATGLVDGIKTIDSPAGRRSEGDLAEPPVRDFKDLGTGTDTRPVIAMKDMGTAKDPRPVHPLKDHLTDEYSGPVRPFGETADKAELPAKPLGQRAMARASELVRPKAAPAEGDRRGGFEPDMHAMSHHGSIDVHGTDEEHHEERPADAGEHGADQRHDRDEEADEGGEASGGDHPEDDAALLASFLLPFAVMAAEDAADGGDEPARGDTRRPEDGGDEEDPNMPNDRGDDDTPPDDRRDEGTPPENHGDRGRQDDEDQRGEEPGEDGDGGKDGDPPDGGGGGDDNGPEDGEPGGEEDPGDGDNEHEDEHDEAETKGANTDEDPEPTGSDDDLPRVPRQRELEERALEGDGEERTDEDTETKEAETVEDEARERELIHAATLADLRELAKHTEIVAPSTGKQNAMRIELTHDHQDAGEYLADLYQGLREGSAELPPVTNWREEITDPSHLREGQIIHVASLRELDELMSRVGGWMNRDAAEARGVIGGAQDFPPGKFAIPGQKPSEALSKIRDFKGRPFHGRIMNIEAMPLPAAMQGPNGHARYFTVSAQLQTTGRAPEPERPTWLYGVRAGEKSRGPNAIQARHGNIGRVPASAVAWRVQARARHIGTDVERNNRMRAIRSGIETKRR